MATPLDFKELQDVRILCLEIAGMVDVPDRYRAKNGQLTEIAPYSERDFRGPEALTEASGPAQIWLKRAGKFTKDRAGRIEARLARRLTRVERRCAAAPAGNANLLATASGLQDATQGTGIPEKHRQALPRSPRVG